MYMYVYRYRYTYTYTYTCIYIHDNHNDNIHVFESARFDPARLPTGAAHEGVNLCIYVCIYIHY